METLQNIYTRRSVRKYLSKPLEFDKIMKIIDAAHQAPSSGNLQNWRFVVVTEKNIIAELPKHCLNQDYVQAPVVILVCSKNEPCERNFGVRGERLYAVQNCACAIQNMLLAAHDLGLGTNWIGAFDEQKIRTIFSLPDDVRAQALITVGYPDEKPAKKNLKPVTDIVFFNKYGNKIRDIALTLRDYSDEIEKKTQAAKEMIEKGKVSIREHLNKMIKK